jgi:hypothetical protein
MDKNKIVMIAPVAVAGILMFAVLAAISSTNQIFAAEKKRTELTLSVSPSGPAKTEENNETKETHTEVPVTISGRLTSEGSGVAGATIFIGSGEEEINTTDTDSGGHYSIATEFPDHNSEHTIHAHTYHIPSDYEESNATTTIKLP